MYTLTPDSESSTWARNGALTPSGPHFYNAMKDLRERYPTAHACTAGIPDRTPDSAALAPVVAGWSNSYVWFCRHARAADHPGDRAHHLRTPQAPRARPLPRKEPWRIQASLERA